MMNKFIIAVHVLVNKHYVYLNCILCYRAEGLRQIMSLHTMLQAKIFLTDTNNFVAHFRYSRVSKALHIHGLSKVYYMVFSNRNHHLQRLIMQDYLGQYSYCMDMFQYSMVLALHNAHSMVHASTDGKILTNFSRNNTHETDWLFMAANTQIYNNLFWLLLLLCCCEYINTISFNRKIKLDRYYSTPNFAGLVWKVLNICVLSYYFPMVLACYYAHSRAYMV